MSAVLNIKWTLNGVERTSRISLEHATEESLVDVIMRNAGGTDLHVESVEVSRSGKNWVIRNRPGKR